MVPKVYALFEIRNYLFFLTASYDTVNLMILQSILYLEMYFILIRTLTFCLCFINFVKKMLLTGCI